MKTPKLRFIEFSGDWESKRLGDIGKIITGNTPSTKDKSNYGNEYLWASPVDLGKSKVINTTKNKLSLTGFNKTRKIPKGSILITCIGSTIGKIGMANEEMSTNQQINTLVCNKNFNNEFIYYALEFSFPRYMLLYITSQAIPIINKNQFQEFIIKVPSLKEQEKIASFLSLVDEKINLQDKKVENLKNYKKGIMQKIFNRELRFKDDNGNDYPNWEEKKLGEVGKIITGNTPSKEKKEYYYTYDDKDKFVWVTPTDIKETKNIYNSITNLSKKGYDISRKLPKNTVLVTCIASIGKNAILKVEGSCNQ